jgi:hypothetical protein
MIIINLLQGSSTFRALKLNNSLAKEPLSTLDATKRVMRILRCQICKSRSPVNCKEQLQAPKCQPSEKVTAAPRGAQSKYTITELELLAIVETLKEFKGML